MKVSVGLLPNTEWHWGGGEFATVLYIYDDEQIALTITDLMTYKFYKQSNDQRDYQFFAQYQKIGHQLYNIKEMIRLVTYES